MSLTGVVIDIRIFVVEGSVLKLRSIRCGAIAFAMAGGFAPALFAADAIPYPNRQHYYDANLVFTAKSTGDVIAYFAGTDSIRDDQLGMLVNGVSTGVFGLDNQTSSAGQQFDLGHANIGDTLTFVMEDLSRNNTLVYSDPSLNSGYDKSTYTGGHNHVYSTNYTATSPLIGSGTPAGLYIAFEDQEFPSTDFSYNDEDFVVSNVAVPEPAGCAILFTTLAFAARRRSRGSLRIVA